MLALVRDDDAYRADLEAAHARIAALEEQLREKDELARQVMLRTDGVVAKQPEDGRFLGVLGNDLGNDWDGGRTYALLRQENAIGPLAGNSHGKKSANLYLRVLRVVRAMVSF
jgi:hypothetical protein